MEILLLLELKLLNNPSPVDEVFGVQITIDFESSGFLILILDEQIDKVIHRNAKNRWLLRTNLWEKRQVDKNVACDIDEDFDVFSPANMFLKFFKG